MRAHRTAGNRPRLRAALALLLALAIGFAVTGLARTGHPHKHTAQVAAVLAVSSVDTQHGGLDLDRSTPVARPATGSVADTTRDSSRSVRSRTAHTPQVRGPPGQASA
jgi:hypothetical protein